MKRPEYSLAYTTAIQVYSRIISQSKTRKGSHIVGALNTVNEVHTGHSESYSPENVVVVKGEAMKGLSSRAVDLCLKMMIDLKFNNALWYFDHTKNTRDATAIKELREKNILYHTDNTRIHFVNPDVIRKGNKLLVAANTAMITSTGKTEMSMIKVLNKKNIQLNPMHLIDLTNTTT